MIGMRELVSHKRVLVTGATGLGCIVMYLVERSRANTVGLSSKDCDLRNGTNDVVI